MYLHRYADTVVSRDRVREQWPALILVTSTQALEMQLSVKGERGKGEGQGEGGGSQGELGEGPGVVDLQRCWGCSEQSYTGRIQDLGSSK